MTDERAVEVTEGGTTSLKIGIEISDGPKTYRLLLTRPVDKEGLIEEIPVETIEAVHELEPGPRGEPPRIAGQ